MRKYGHMYRRRWHVRRVMFLALLTAIIFLTGPWLWSNTLGLVLTDFSKVSKSDAGKISYVVVRPYHIKKLFENRIEE